MERADKKRFMKSRKNGRIRMIRNVLLIYAALICVVSNFQRKSVPASGDSTLFRCEAAGLGHDRSLASVDLRGG